MKARSLRSFLSAALSLKRSFEQSPFAAACLGWLLLVMSSSTSFGQVTQFSVHAGPNFPFVPTKTNSAEMVTYAPLPAGSSWAKSSSTSIREAYESHPGFNVGGALRYMLNDRFFLSAGVGASYLRFKRKITVDIHEITMVPWDWSQPPTGPVVSLPGIGGTTDYQITSESYYKIQYFDSGDMGKTDVWFVQVPVMAGVSLVKDHLILQGGFNFSLTASARTNRPTYYYGSPVGPIGISSYFDPRQSIEPDYGFRKTTEEMSSLAIGGILKVGYRFGKHLQVDLGAQPNITPLYKEGHRGTDSRMTTFSLGISYTFVRRSVL